MQKNRVFFLLCLCKCCPIFVIAGECDDMTEATNGSDIVLEAVLEAEVARNAKDFFLHPENQIQ